MNTNNTDTPTNMKTTDFSELSHAAQCLDIYLHNTAEIYERYTTVLIGKAENYTEIGASDDELRILIKWDPLITGAIQTAARLVRKHDHLTPPAKDMEAVTRNYAAYIVETAQDNIKYNLNS